MEPGGGVVRDEDAVGWEAGPHDARVEAGPHDARVEAGPHDAQWEPAPAGRWEARLELGYAARGDQTVPVLRRHVGPLRVQRHFVPEPGLCEHVIVHPPGGIVGGDRLGIDVEVGAGAAVRLTTPGATKWYRSAAAEAEQDTLLRVRSGGRLAWMPQEQIVFSGARARSALRIEAEAGATFIAWDVTVLGRQHGDEPFVSGSWRSRLAVGLAGRVVLDERGAVAGEVGGGGSAAGETAGLMGAAVGWAGAEVLATVVAAGPGPLAANGGPGVGVARSQTMAAALEAARGVGCRDGHVGVTVLEETLLVGRLLGRRSADAFAWVAAVAAAVLPRLGWEMATTPRIWRT